MQYVNTCPVLNVEESDRLSFMPYLFGTDFMLAELQVYALAKKWMPEYEGKRLTCTVLRFVLSVPAPVPLL